MFGRAYVQQEMEWKMWETRLEDTGRRGWRRLGVGHHRCLQCNQAGEHEVSPFKYIHTEVLFYMVLHQIPFFPLSFSVLIRHLGMNYCSYSEVGCDECLKNECCSLIVLRLFSDSIRKANVCCG